MNSILTNPTPQSLCQLYRTLYPDNTTTQLLGYLRKDLEVIANSEHAGSSVAQRQLDQWKETTTEFKNIMSKNTQPLALEHGSSTATPANADRAITNNYSGIQVAGDWNQNNIYKEEKRPNEGDPVNHPAKQARLATPQPSNETDGSATVPVSPSSPPPTESTTVSVLEEWDWFLFAASQDEDVSVYSPEKHGIVVCGENIASRPGLPDSYEHLNIIMQEDLMSRSRFRDIFKQQLDYVNSVLDLTSLPDMLRALRRLPSEITREQEDRYFFLQDIMTAIIRDIAHTNANLTYETALNTVAIFPAARISVLDYAEAGNSVEFLPGEIFLQSMAQQLTKVDNYNEEFNGYKADGIIKVNAIKGLEVALFETSGGITGGHSRKYTFDFHKGMFGLVSMMKGIADAFPYGTYEAMKDVKLYFVHCHGNKIRVWSFAVSGPGDFRMIRVDKCLIPKNMDNQGVILGYIRLFWDLRVRIKNTIKAIQELREVDQLRQNQYRYEQLPREENLSWVIDPKIIKITEKKHSSCFDADGELYSSPPLPPSFY